MHTQYLMRNRLMATASTLGLSILIAPFLINSAFAGGSLPAGGQYVAGKGSIGGATGSLVVKQSSTTGIIDWNSFSIGKGRSVTFDNGTGATLNEVTGGTLSTIAGSLHASGSIYLINQSGVIVSGSGKIVTGGSFDASTQDGDGKQRGDIVNAGSIRSAHGSVRLSGANVSTSGSVAVMRGGQIWLTSSGTTSVSGTLDADNAQGKGGTIVATGKTLDVAGTAKLTASGVRGGTILLGGDVHGGAIASDNLVKANVATAQNTAIAKGASISANATKGTGGNIVIWSDGRTSFGGAISATGRTSGGFAEVSSHDLLGFTGRADLTSAEGATGTLLLDPENVTISNTPSVTDTCSAGVCTPTGDNSILNVSVLEAALATASVRVSTGSTGAQNGDITVAAPIAWSSNSTLELAAYHSVLIDQNIDVFGGAEFEVYFNHGGTGGSFTIGDGAAIDYGHVNNGGKFAINGTAYTLIYTMAGLQAINASTSALEGNYALATTIDAFGLSSWTPIGVNSSGTVSNSGNGFSGTFEGLGNAIDNLTIDLPSIDHVGLFGYSSGTIRDVGVVGGTITGQQTVGGLAGQSTGSILNAFSTAAVTSESEAAGGLVGFNGGVLSDVFATGAVNGGAEIGGLAGLNEGSISNAYASGSVTTGSSGDGGGLVGQNGGSIVRSYATGSVGGGAAIGGLVGYNASTGTIDESYEAGAATGTSDVGGLVGQNAGTIGGTTRDFYNSTRNTTGVGANTGTTTYSGLSTSAMETASNFTGWTDFGTTPGGASGQTWVIVDVDSTLNNAGAAGGGTSPMLLSEYSTNIVTPHQLELMNLNLAGNYNLSANINLIGTNGADLWNSSGFVPIGGGTSTEFTGSLNGNGHTLSSIFIADTTQDYAGLFGYIGAAGSVDNLNLKSATVSSNAAGEYVGILAGVSYGTISGVTISGNLTIDAASGEVGGLAGFADGEIISSSSSAAVSNSTTGGYLGGLVGYSEATIEDSSASGAVTGSGSAYAGGLIGYNSYSPVSKSYATGAVQVADGTSAYVGGLVGDDYGGRLVSSYATGEARGSDSDIGGLTGYSYYDDIVNSYATGAVTGRDSIAGGLVGYSEYGNVSGSHATGAVTVTYGAGTANYAGGLIGEDYDYSYAEVANSYATGNVSDAGKYAAAGGLIGYLYYFSNVSSSHATGTVTINGEGYYSSAGGLIGESYYLNTIANSYATGTVTGDNAAYAGGLIGYSYYYNAINNSYATGNVEAYCAGGLIGYSYEYNFVTNSHATGGVTGLLNGSSTAYAGGLIGYSYEDENLANDYATGNVNGGSTSSHDTDAGGLIGYAYDSYGLDSSYAKGAVTNAYYAGGLIGDSEIAIVNSYATGNVVAVSNGDAGGLVGYSDATISDSYATGTVTGKLGIDTYVGGLVGGSDSAIDHSYATGNIIAGGTEVQAGGLVGYNTGTLSYVYATGSVTGDGTGTSSATYGGLVGYTNSNITQAYSIGDVSGTGSAQAGGLIGEYVSGTITAGYWNTQTSGQSSSQGGVGLTTAQLQSGLPAGFSSADWGINAGHGYPYLLLQAKSVAPPAASDASTDLIVNTGVPASFADESATVLADISQGEFFAGTNEIDDLASTRKARLWR